MLVTLDTLAPTTSGADRNFLRLKTSLFGKLDYDKKAALFLKVTNEMKWYGLGPYDSFKNNPTGISLTRTKSSSTISILTRKNLLALLMSGSDARIS